MRSHVCSTVPAALAVLVLACHDGSGSGAPPVPEALVTNHAVAAARIIGAGELRLIAASEAAGGTDLDGDGDVLDLVLQLLDLEQGTLVNTGLALFPRFQRDEVPPPEFGCTDELAVFLVSEPETGHDVDGDGDPTEVATWTFHRRTGLLDDLPLAYGGLELDGELAAFFVWENDELRLRVLDAADGSLITLPGKPSAMSFVQDGLVAFTASELGASDLNLDGDAADDLVLQLYDTRSHRLVNTTWALASWKARLLGGTVSFAIHEQLQGGTDLDGDGENDDIVLVSQDLQTGRIRIPGLSGVEFADYLGGDEEYLLLLTSEENGDRNGDGDTEDSVAVLYDPVSDELLDTGLAVNYPALVTAGRWIGAQVDERAQGNADLDGDGAVQGDVLHAYDAHSGAVRNLGFQGIWLGALAGHLLAARDERQADWNGDGDRNDYVMFDWSERTQRASNVGFSVAALQGVSGDTALLIVVEPAQADLNGDGDSLDLVYALYHAGSGRMDVLGLATTSADGRLDANGRAAVLVSERAQGADLNADGDQFDDVLHTIDLGR